MFLFPDLISSQHLTRPLSPKILKTSQFVLVGSFNGWHYFRILAATGDKQILDMADMHCCYAIEFGGPAPGMEWGTEGYEEVMQVWETSRALRLIFLLIILSMGLYEY